MYTVVYELYRREDVSREEFVDYWLNTHKPIAMQIPRLRRYELWPVSTAEDVLGDQVEGFVFMQYDSEEDFEHAHASPEFAATAEDAAKFARHYTRYVVQPHKAI